MTYQRSELRKRVLQSLGQHNIRMPESPGKVEEDDQFPADLTVLPDLEVRRIMSFWTSQLGYLNSVYSRCMVDAMAYKRDMKDYERTFKRNYPSDKDTKAWEIDAELAGSKIYEQKVNRWEEAEAMVTVLKSLREAYEAYYASASRELTARLGEFARESSYRSGA